MKIEKRGKYPGVKAHLEKDECELLMSFAADYALAHPDKTGSIKGKESNGIILAFKLGKKIKLLLDEEPGLLQERTEEEILATLSKEAIESDLKLKAIGQGADWKKVKVEVLK